MKEFMGIAKKLTNLFGVKRLLAVPYARYCVKAQDYKERERKRMIAR